MSFFQRDSHVRDRRKMFSKRIFPRSGGVQDESVERAALDLGYVSSSPTLGVEIT